jgi:hypothetical protein
MRKALLLVALTANPLLAQNWSVGGGVGPFIFGHFVERTVRIGTETGGATNRTRLSAGTRAGVAADIERDINPRFAVRLEATWVGAPLRIKSASGDRGTNIDAGKLNLTTFVLPLVIRINPNGAFRFHVMGGPAYAFYNVHRRAGGGATIPFFEGTREVWGGAGAVGAGWYLRRNFGIEWQAEYIVTRSPFRAADFAPISTGITIPKPRNGHTTIGLRYRF